MFIWRIENDEGIGPYHTGDATSLNLYDSSNVHPSPREDISEWKNMDYRSLVKYRFGFKCTDDLSRWFNGRSLIKLYENGFRIVKYKVDRRYVMIGKRQVAFDITKAKRVLVHNKYKRFLRF